MKIAFTGTQIADDRDTPLAEAIVQAIHECAQNATILDGVNEGWDAIAGRAAHAAGLYVKGIVPAIREKVANDFEQWCDEIEYCPRHEGKSNSEEYMFRNQQLVDECDILIAVPRGIEPAVRSGTWATYRRAVRAGKPRYITALSVPPDRVRNNLSVFLREMCTLIQVGSAQPNERAL